MTPTEGLAHAPSPRDAADADAHRARLLAAMPVTEHRMELDGTPTAVLVGGDGPPMVLLHGPGEPAVWWMRVVPELVRTHRVVAPDMPGHGATALPEGRLDAGQVMAWLDALIERTCERPPVLVGHALGGAVAARFAITRGDRVGHLVLVDSLGFGRFRPSLRFAVQMMRFMAQPTEERHERFFAHCMHDPAGVRAAMGDAWAPFLAYSLHGLRSPPRKQALQAFMREVGMPRIPSPDLDRISIPTTLIWGRHDQAVRLRVAQAASRRHGWPLHVIEDARDDPKLERPQAFVETLRAALARDAA